MTFKAIVQRVHLWAGLILGIQVLLWMASGVIMSWFPIELVRGETSAFQSPPVALEPSTYASPGGILAQAGGATSVELTHFLGQPVYRTTGPGAAAGLFNASTGERLSPISEALARKVAELDYVGAGEIVSADLVSFPPQEYRGERPVWRIDYNDKLNTRIYVSPSSGEVKARRNNIWRLYDFFWMLHIMDYEDREDFNNPLVMGASAAGLVFAISGMIIVVYRLRRRRYLNDLELASGARHKADKTLAEKQP
ncbi:PepSY domain-containing protein [Hyphococcus flavus]|uniref:PepSY domain-containing protein n=1 Tax=Hyphococcus flavus TaxID=1866326 RepID=A0AAE9ZAN3_9PROT|nr:PepSY domain-containing protein [Hyphococcus flavus]WDI30773.1 PepSY domain-containing protein [Hyphococcus flavus]